MTESKCPVSRIDGEGNKHPCRNPHGHSGEHRYTLAWCPATKGDCHEPCIGSNCNKLSSGAFPAAVAEALAESDGRCGDVSPIGAAMLCSLKEGHPGYHQNREAMSSWPDGYNTPSPEPHAMNTMRERAVCAYCGEKLLESRVVEAEFTTHTAVFCTDTCLEAYLRIQPETKVVKPKRIRRGKLNGQTSDPIRPDYYHGTAVDDFIDEFKLGFRLGNAVKYIARHEHKDGLKDLKKALWYLTKEIEKRERS